MHFLVIDVKAMKYTLVVDRKSLDDFYDNMGPTGIDRVFVSGYFDTYDRQSVVYSFVKDEITSFVSYEV